MEKRLNALINELSTFNFNQDNLHEQFDLLINKSEQITNLLLDYKIEPFFIKKISSIPVS